MSVDDSTKGVEKSALQATEIRSGVYSASWNKLGAVVESSASLGWVKRGGQC